MDENVVWEILDLLLNRPAELTIVPLPRRARIDRMARKHPLLFVTARDKAEPIFNWLTDNLPEVPPPDIRVIATGDPDAKLACLQDHHITHFVEDRLETCFQLAATAFNPCFTTSPGIDALILFPLFMAGRIWPTHFLGRLYGNTPDLGWKIFVVVHGHFYQPPRENPWIEEIELEASAYPFPDWNARITSRMLHPQRCARILDGT